MSPSSGVGVFGPDAGVDVRVVRNHHIQAETVSRVAGDIRTQLMRQSVAVKDVLQNSLNKSARFLQKPQL